MSRNEDAATERGAAETLLVVALATMLSLIVFTVPLTTLADISSSLSAGPNAQAWIMSGMPVGAAVGLLGFGALGDNYGRRRIFLYGLADVACSSFAAAMAQGSIALIVARVIQGVGSAAILACGLGLVGQVYRGSHGRARATGIWAAALGAGVALGPVLAALLLPFGGWHASHWLIGGISVVLFGMAYAVLPHDVSENRGAVDASGSLVMAAAILCFLAALTESRFGLGAPVLALFAGSAVLVALFVRIELRATNPVLHLGLFRRPDFVGAMVGAFASGAGVLAIMTMVPMVLERGFGIAPFRGAIILMAWSATTAIAALGARIIPKSVSPRVLLIASMIGCAVGQAATLLATPWLGFGWILPGLFIAGFSNGVLNAALGHQAVQSVPLERTAMGSAANNTARYLGSAVGITLATILIAHGAESGVEGLLTGWRVAVLISVGFSLAGAAMSALVRSRHS